MAVETPQGTMSLSATFKQDGEKLTGTQTSQMGEIALEGSVKGTDIAFAVVINMQGQDMTITYTGKIDGDAMSGAIEFGGYGSSTWTAQKRRGVEGGRGTGAEGTTHADLHLPLEHREILVDFAPRGSTVQSPPAGDRCRA